MLLILCTDLIFSTRITGTAKALEVPYAVARSKEALAEKLSVGGIARVILDLNIATLDPIEALQTIKAQAPQLTVIAFLSHVQVELAQQARDHGADQVMPRSTFVAQLPALLKP